MAFDTFMQIGSPSDVPGESTDSKHAGWIEIYSFSLGASNPVTVGSGSTGLSGGKVSVSSFNCMKKTELSSPVLFDACATGKHFPTAKVILRKAGGTALEYLTYEFGDVMIESIQWSGSSGGDDTPSESLSIAFGKVTITYEQQASADGSEGKKVVKSYDSTTNTAA